MKNAYIVGGISFIAVIIVGFVLAKNSSTQTQTTTQSSNKKYTMSDISTHSSGDSCWTVVSGNVYDVTISFISRHEGGADKILSLCGKDGTQAFEGQHSDQRKPANELSRFLIGSI